jgi:DNA gyrase subunit A
LFSLPAKKEERAEGWFVLTVSAQGLVKKSSLTDLPGPSAHSVTIVKVNEDDRLVRVLFTDGKAEILLATADGMAIRFLEDEIRPMGLVAAGVGGIKLGARDEVVGAEVVSPKGELLFIASNGLAKRVAVEQFPLQGRYGQGVMAWKLPRTAQVIGIATGKGATRLTLHLEKLAPKAVRLDEAPLQSRTSVGKPIVELKTGDRISLVSVPWISPLPAGSKAKTTEKPKATIGKKVSEEPEKAEQPVSNGEKRSKTTAPKEKAGQTSAVQTSFDKLLESEKPPRTRKKPSTAKNKTIG